MSPDREKRGLPAVFGLALASVLVLAAPLPTPVWADAHSSAGGGDGGRGQGKQGGGGSDSHASDHEDGHDDSDHDDGHEPGAGGSRGGHERIGSPGSGQRQLRERGSSDGSGTGGAGGKPVWAQEGVPEVELGRLNVARSPTQVLDRAEAEALAILSASSDMAAFYNLPLSEMVERLRNEWDESTVIDSPLQNLALFEQSLKGNDVFTRVGVRNDPHTLMAVFLGVASDKAIPVGADTTLAISTILGAPLSPAEAAALAADAEEVRRAVSDGHG